MVWKKGVIDPLSAMQVAFKRLLMFVIVTLFVVTTCLCHVYFEDDLITITLAFIVMYILTWLGLKAYKGFESYSVVIKELLLTQTLQSNNQFNDTNLSSSLDAVYKIFSQLPIPIAMLSAEGKILFFNRVMYQNLKVPLCVGMSAIDCGFEVNGGKVKHVSFAKDWKLDYFVLASGEYRLITASYILEQLQREKRSSQKNMIRILSHELNDSLTPIASISDSLLSACNLTRIDLENGLIRIKNRSEKLLAFIKLYAQLNQLPQPKSKLFNLKQMAFNNAKEVNAELTYQGRVQIMADPMLIEQLIINLFKNAKEASECACNLFISVNNDAYWQTIKVEDRGVGFSNLENALTPLYTTKKHGQGLGLALCNDIIEAHKGQIQLYNTEVGAGVEITLPLLA